MESEFFDENGFCLSCGWCCEYLESHIICSRGTCEYLLTLYEFSIDDDGELVATKK